MIAAAQLPLLGAAPAPPEPDPYAFEYRVLFWLRKYAPLAVSRATLVELTGLPDRTVREAVTALRLAGWLVVSGSDHRGYRLATSRDDPEVAQTIREYEHREGAIREVREGLERGQRWLATAEAMEGAA